MVCGKIRSEDNTTEKRKLSKKNQKQYDRIKRRLTESSQEWNDWIFQIHQKIGQVNQRSRDERKYFCVF